jgi:hypothetical protein
LLTYSISRTSTTFDFFFFSSLIIRCAMSFDEEQTDFYWSVGTRGREL